MSKISVKESMDREALAQILEDLRKSLIEGKVVVRQGDEFVVLTPAGVVSLEMEAVVKKEKQKLSLELSWREEAHTAPQAAFTVTSEEPEIKRPDPLGEEGASAAASMEPGERAVVEKPKGKHSASKL